MLAASYEAKSYGIQTAMGGSAGSPALPAGDRRPTPDGRLRGGEPCPLRPLRGHRLRPSRGSRSTRPSSTSAGCSGSPAHPGRSPSASAAPPVSASGSRSPSESPARNTSPRSPAQPPNPTGSSSSRPRASSPFCTRFRSSGSGGSARRPLPGFAAIASPPSASSPASPSQISRQCWAPLRHGTCTPLRTTTTPARSAGAPGGARSARNTPSAEHASHPRRSRPTSSRSSTASPADCARPDASAARSSSVSASTTTRRATRSYTLPHPTAQTRPILTAARALLATAQPLIERRGLTLIGVTIANLENDLPLQLCLPFDCDNGELLDAALDEIRTRYGPTAVTRGILLGRRPALDMPLLPD